MKKLVGMCLLALLATTVIAETGTYKGWDYTYTYVGVSPSGGSVYDVTLHRVNSNRVYDCTVVLAPGQTLESKINKLVYTANCTTRLVFEHPYAP